jgi:hypothetical protein
MALLPNYKDIIDLLKKGASIEAQEKIMELREGAIALQEENSKLKERIKELESELNKKKKYNGMHLSIGLLSENRKKALFVKNAMIQSIEKGNWHCKTCKNNFFEDSYKPTNPTIGVVRSRNRWDSY